MHILFLAAEMAPLVKIGGLGDVAGALPHALRKLPSEPDVRVVIPLHGAIDQSALDLKPVAAFQISNMAGFLTAQAFSTQVNEVPVYLISGPSIPIEAPVYSSIPMEDGHKYTFFSLAALELARMLDWSVDILHAHDWHTAPAVYQLSRIREHDDFYQNTCSVFTIHNLPYMGQGTDSALQSFGLPPALGSSLPVWARQTPLPLALWSADVLTTVSPNYAREILGTEFGSGLNGFLQSRRGNLHGILNGLDTERWNPQTDDSITAKFNGQYLEDRIVNKTALQRAMGLPEEKDIPLLAMVSRLDPQKGVDIAVDALRQLSALPWQAVILGNGDPLLEAVVQQLAAQFPQRVRARIAFDVPLGRQIYAGADMLLLPSRYEPCGLAQMIAMRYGCLPVGRETGGLADTIRDPSLQDGGTGFLFPEASPKSLAFAIRRALAVYRQPRRWQAMQRRAMRQNFSWQRSAEEYLALYRSLSASN